MPSNVRILLLPDAPKWHRAHILPFANRGTRRPPKALSGHEAVLGPGVPPDSHRALPNTSRPSMQRELSPPPPATRSRAPASFRPASLSTAGRPRPDPIQWTRSRRRGRHCARVTVQHWRASDGLEVITDWSRSRRRPVRSLFLGERPGGRGQWAHPCVFFRHCQWNLEHSENRTG